MKKRRRLARRNRFSANLPEPARVRSSRSATLIDLAILASIWLIFTLPFLIAGRTILPLDWHGVIPSGPFGYPRPRLPHFYSLDADTAVGLDLAGFKYFADSLRNGHLPFWNPYQHFGLQYLGEGGTLVLYPFNLLHLILPRAYWDFPQYFQLYCAALGLYLLAREFGISRPHAVLGGTCTFAAGYLQGYLCVTTLMSGMVWMPLVLLAVERAIRTNSIRQTLAPGVTGVFLLSTSCNAGLGIIIVAAISVYAIARSGMSRRWRALAKAAVPLAIGGLCSAPVLLPFLTNAAQFHSALAPRGADNPLRLLQLPALFLPYLYSPMRTSGAFGDPNALDGSYWPLAWVPPPLALLAISGVVLAFKNRHGPMIVLSSIAAWLGLWAMAVPPFNAVSFVPILWRLSTGYVMGPIQSILCLLAAYGVSCLGAETPRVWKLIIGVWAAFLCALLAIASIVYRHAAKPDIDWVMGSSVPAILWAVIPALVLWGSMLVAKERRRWAVFFVSLAAVIASGVAFFPSGANLSVTVWLRLVPFSIFLLVAAVTMISLHAKRLDRAGGWALVIIPLLAMNTDTVLRRPAWPTRYDPFTAPSFVTYLQQHAADWRSYMTDLFVFPNFSSAFGIPSVNVLGAILPYGGIHFFGRFLQPFEVPVQVYGVAGRVPGTSQPSPVAVVIKNKRYWDYVGVRYIVASMYSHAPDPQVFELALRDPPALVWRNVGAQPIVYLAPEASRVTDWKEAQDRFASATDLRRTAFLEAGPASVCPSNPAYPNTAVAADVSGIRVELNRIYAVVDAHTSGALVLVSNYAAGWSARINGVTTNVYRANGAFQAACLARPGQYQVVFEFEPPLWRLGLSSAAIGIFLLFLFARRYPSRSAAPSQPSSRIAS